MRGRKPVRPLAEVADAAVTVFAGRGFRQAGISDGSDFEIHLVQHGGMTFVYDGDGNRVSKTVGGVTTNYLVDTVNPTGRRAGRFFHLRAKCGPTVWKEIF